MSLGTEERPQIAALAIGDPPDLWASLGFVVEGDAAHVSGIRHVLGSSEPGIRGWSLRNFAGDALDGLAFTLPSAPAEPTPPHPNGVIALDHLVFSTPDMGRTIENCEASGIDLRRTRNTSRGMQAFFKLGEVILEVVGPRAPAGNGPPRCSGLAWTVAEPEATAAFFGDRLRPFKPAVQPGRTIATLDRAVGSTVPQAFLSPEPT